MYDDISAGNVPADGDLYAGYDDGHWPDADALQQRFPGKTVIRISVFASDNQGDCLDVEQGDATPEQAPGWVQRRRQAGHPNPMVYCSASPWGDVKRAFANQGIPEPPYWVADYDHSPAIPQQWLDQGCVAKQYESTPGYDISSVVDHIPGIDPAPTTTTPVPWPFSVRDDGANPGQDGSGQWRHIDQGQDLQAAVNTNVIAIADGTIRYAHDSQGFGDPYPVLALDTPIDGNPAVYYGHQHPDTTDGGKVIKGQVIAIASQTPGGNAAGLPGWLEFGWWNNGPTGDGQSMHDHLLGAVVPAPPPPATYPLKDGKMRHDLTIATDNQGNGYGDLALDFAQVEGVFPNGADPATNHGYSPIPRLAPLLEGAGTRIVLEGGPPNGQVLVHVTAAT